MGLFDFLILKGSTAEAAKASKVPQLARVARDKRAQNHDRQGAIADLGKLKSEAAVAALLGRFTFAIDPSITDLEEKEAVFEAVVAADRAAMEPLRAFAATAESVAWPIRIWRKLLPDDELVVELVELLDAWDTEYARCIDAKLELLAALEEYVHPEICAAVEPFLRDANESARYRAVRTMLAQREPTSLPSLLTTLADEESMRIRAKIAEGLAALRWEIPATERDTVGRSLPAAFGVDRSGVVRRYD